jgi:uncharacterized membrane protein YeaQ/YmgE (transglycosylase-associated protein family)
MMLLLWVIAGLVVGWGAGRLLALKRGGIAGDLLAGVLGSVFVGWGLWAMQGGNNSDVLTAALSGLIGALAVTLVRRAYLARYRHVPV